MNCHRNVNSILPTQLQHKFSYIVAILIHNHFESPNTCDNALLTNLCDYTTRLCLVVQISHAFVNNALILLELYSREQ
jgi:hypothetical protein